MALFGPDRRIRNMREPIFRAHFDTQSVRFECLINNCPAFAHTGSQNIRLGVATNEWLRTGRNNLRILCEPPQHADAPPDQQPQRRFPTDAFLRGKITAGDMTEDRETREEITLLEYELDLSNDDGTYPREITETFNVPSSFPAWAWTTAPPLTPDNALRAEVFDLVRRIHAALSTNDLNTVLSLQRNRIRETAAAYFQTEADRSRLIRDDLALLTGDNTADLRDLQPDTWQLPLYADNRLLRVDDASGHPVLRFDFPETTVFAALPLFLTRDDAGRLIWVR